MDNTVASIPQSLDWPVSLTSQSAMEFVSALGLSPETIVSILSNKLGGRIAYSEDSYRKIGTSEKHIDIIRNGYKPPWKGHAPRQGNTPNNPKVSLKASNILDTEVCGLLDKGAIREVSQVPGEYVS